MSKKILICGDSFALTDKRYPELHFSEKIKKKIPDCEIINLAIGGHSNSLIELQVRQGLQFDPDAIIIVFTDIWRTEFLRSDSPYFNEVIKEVVDYPRQPKWQTIRNHNLKKYISSAHLNQPTIPKADSANQIIEIFNNLQKYTDDDYLLIKNYFIISSIFNLLTIKNIPFCFNLGGIGYKFDEKPSFKDKLVDQLLPKHFLPNEFVEHSDKEIDIDLWKYADHFNGPYFHVEDEAIQIEFANQCIAKLGL